MKAQPLLLVSAILLVASGAALLFAPQELGASLARLGHPSSPAILQLLGGALFALGFLDWLNRFAIIGGIYGRPLVVANFAFYLIAATTLVRVALTSGSTAAEVLPAAVTSLLAAGFLRALLVTPKAVGR